MDNLELKPCPFCGGEAKVIEYIYTVFPHDPNRYGVKCRVCLAETSQFFDTPKAAAKAWNSRAEINDSNALDALKKEKRE